MGDTHGGDRAADLVAELTTDHRLMENLLAVLERPRGYGRDAHTWRATVEGLTAAVVAHIAAEEEYLLPAVREYLADGHQFADAALTANRRIEELLATIEHKMTEPEELGPNNRDNGHIAAAEGLARISELAADLRCHTHEQERALFPALAVACPPGLLDDLGAKVRAAKEFGPTRPHPTAPRNAVARKALDPVTGLLDRLRDLVQGRRRRRGRPRRSP